MSNAENVESKSKTLNEIAQYLRTPKTVTKKVTENSENKLVPKVQLIYAFNGTGKTRLSQAFKELITKGGKDKNKAALKILYYNAFTEDLFYWNNNYSSDIGPKLNIHPNKFIHWILKEGGEDSNITKYFQHYVNNKLTPRFSEDLLEVGFSLERGDDRKSGNLKISKGEESCFIWSVFYTLIQEVITTLNIAEPDERSTNQFNDLEYIFIDDPVSSLDENHLIQLAVDLAQLIKSSKSDLKFIITTHNPLFYNVLYNELKKSAKYLMTKLGDGTYQLVPQCNDSPFAYHLYLMSDIKKAIESGQVQKYHFNFLRNILEKTATFLGYENWGELLPKNKDGKINPYETRMMNIYSHSKHSGDEVALITEEDKRVLTFLVKEINEKYHFNNQASENKSKIGTHP